MEKLSEILSNLKDRFSSPLIFSFLVSWLVINWKIPIALLWHNSDGIQGVQVDLINYLSGLTDFCHSIVIPLIFALGYTFLGPIIHNGISAFNTWNERWGNSVNLSISKGSKVPFSKYFSFKEEYDKRSKMLEEIISEENTTLTQLSEAQSNILAKDQEINQLKTEIANYKDATNKLSNTEVINGNWKRKVKTAIGSGEVQTLEINQSNVFVREGVNFEHKYQINSFTYIAQIRSVRFMLLSIKPEQSGFYSFEDLEIRGDEMVGWEYKTGSRSEVIYSRY